MNRFVYFFVICGAVALLTISCGKNKAEEQEPVLEVKSPENEVDETIAPLKATDVVTEPKQVPATEIMNEAGELKITAPALGETFIMNVAFAKKIADDTISLELIHNSRGTMWALNQSGDSVVVQGLSPLVEGSSVYIIEPGHLLMTMKGVKPGKTTLTFYNRKIVDSEEAAETGFELTIVVDDNNKIAEVRSKYITEMPKTGIERDHEPVLAITAPDDSWSSVDIGNGAGVMKFSNNRLRIVLREEPTTGRSWSYYLSSYAMKSIADEYIISDNPRDRVGVGGDRVLDFEGGFASYTDIELINKAAWAPRTDNDKGIKIRVITNKDGRIIKAVEDK